MTRPRVAYGVLIMALAWPVFAAAADLPVSPPASPATPAAPSPAPPPSPAATPVPGSGSAFAPPDATCLEWNDGCRTCQKPPSGEVACSNVGLACTAQAPRCTRR